MALTTSLHTALTGLSNSSRMLNVTGNNIANVNTTAFKRSRTDFQTSLNTQLSSANGPTASHGGQNPAQVGHGTMLAGITRDFRGGPLQPTGMNTDLAIDGNGFFIVDDGGTQRYTRSGNFNLDANFNLVTHDGQRVQGFGADEDGRIMDGRLQDINIPLGNLTVAEATTSVQMGGNLNAGGEIATQGSINVSNPLFTDAAATTPATASDMIESLYDSDGKQLFNVGDVITFQNVSKGGARLPEKTFEIGANNTTGSDAYGATLGEFAGFLESVIGIDAGISGGVQVDANGQIAITGNSGTVNDVNIDPSDIVVNKNTDNALSPFAWDKQQQANGESVRTTFMAYDSLGNEMDFSLSMVLENKSNAGTTWRYYVQGDENPDLQRALATGTVQFDSAGHLLSDTAPAFTVDRSNTGAQTPQLISIDLDPEDRTFSALSDESSKIATINRNGAPIGTLEDFHVSPDGTIDGIFSNSLTRVLGQVATANFSNPQGLAEGGANLFDTTANSGAPQIGTPTTGGLGRIVGSALEQSNVDLSEEFIDMIAATTGFSANSRVLSTSDRLIQELLNTIR